MQIGGIPSPESLMPGRAWIGTILLVSAAVILLTIYCLSQGITIIFMHLYYIPIVLLAYRYRRSGFWAIALLSFTYLGLVVAFQPGDPATIQGAVIRVIVFLGIGALVIYLSESLETFRKELEKSRQFQHRVLENANVWMMVLDAGARVIEWNPAAETMSGYTLEEVRGKNGIWKGLYPDPEYRRDITRRINEIITRRSYLENFSTVVTGKDGQKKTILWNTRELPRPPGEPPQYIGVGVDITEQKRAEEEVTRQAQRTQKLLELNRMKDSPFLDLLNYSLEACLQMTMSGYSFIGLISPDESVMTIHSWSKDAMKECTVSDKPMHYPIASAGIWGECIRKRTPFVLNDYGSSHPAKHGYPEGHVPITRYLGVPIFDTGRIVAILAVANKPDDYDEGDINALTTLGNHLWELLHRRRAEQLLTESEEKYRDLVENIDEVIYIRDEQGTVTYISRAVEELTGFSPSEIVGHRLFEFILDEDRPKVSGIMDASNRGERGRYQFRVITKQGGFRWVNASVSPIGGGEASAGVRGVLIDVTQQKELEDSLRDSRRLLEDILNTVTVRVFWKDKNLVYLGCNAAFARDAGYQTPGEVIGKDDYAMGWRDNAELYRADDRFVIGHNSAKLLYEEPQVTPGGDTIWLLTNKIPLRNEKGEAVGVLGTYFDITSLKSAEEALKRSEQRNARLLEAVPDLMFTISRDGRYLDFHVPDRAVLAIPEAQILGRNVRDTGFSHEMTELMMERIALAIDTQHLQQFEYDLALPGGTRHYEARMVALGRDEVLAIVRDLTEQKALQDALTNSEAKYRLLIEQAEEGIWIVDSDYRTTFVNASLAGMFGYRPEEMLGRHVVEFMPDSAREAHMKRVRERLAGKSERFEQQFVRKDGSTFWVIASTSPVFEKGEVAGAFSMLTDITDRKTAEGLQKRFTEELEQKVIARTEALNTSLQEKVVLLREVHHRVKNNLQIIISLMNLQMRKADDTRLRELLQETQDRVRAMSLVHEKLYVSEDLSHISLHSYLHSLVSQLFSSHGDIAGKVTLHLEFDPIMSDISTAISLGLIVNELVSNSLKHAFPDGASGGLTVAGRVKDGGIVMTVSDDGIGLPAGFDWRNTPTLGLHLVSAMVRQLNGRIERVNVGKGTMFSVVIPMAGKGDAV